MAALVAPLLPLRRSFAAVVVAVAMRLGDVQAQLPPMQGGAPSPNSLLNDLRAIQFPPAGGAGAQPQGGGMPQGFGGGMPQGFGTPPAQPAAGAFGGMPPQGFGGMPPQGGAMPAQG